MQPISQLKYYRLSIVFIAALIISAISYYSCVQEKSAFVKWENYQNSKLTPRNGWKALQESIKYPDIYYRSGIEGNTYVSLKIDSTGKMFDLNLYTNSAQYFKDTVEYELKQIEWLPSKQNGIQIMDSVRFVVKFYLMSNEHFVTVEKH